MVLTAPSSRSPLSARRSLPDVANTRPKSLRIPDDLWSAALDKAQAEGLTLTDVVVRALERFLRR